MAEAVLGLGSNLGARRALFWAARAMLDDVPGLTISASSPLYHTPPLGPPQPDYLNAALLVSIAAPARTLLAHVQQVELLLRRQRGVHWGPRTLDIDILHWSEGPIDEPGLTVPHPGLLQRNFALAPLLDVLPSPPAAFQQRLAALGAPRSEPFEPLFSRDQQTRDLLTSCQVELPELLSAFGTALCATLPEPAPNRDVRPFTLALPERGAPLLALNSVQQLIGETLAAGFAARQLAVTDVREGTLTGIMSGSEIAAPRLFPNRAFAVENTPAGARVRIRA